MVISVCPTGNGVVISVCPTGNGGVLAYRLLADRGGTLRGFRVLVMNLCVSDGLMGVYLLLIGVADAWYRGVYVSIDTQWRHSVMCRAAGFLALVSSEVTLVLFLLTVSDFVLAYRSGSVPSYSI